MATAAVHPAPAVSIGDNSPLALWHLLSLDAPAVAALWTLFIARSFAVRLTPAAPIALAVAVWLLYAGDRLNDASHDNILQDRHHFHFLHRKAFFIVMVCALPVLCELLLHLQPHLREAWLLLSLPLLLYFVGVHALRLRRIPKEAVVAIFFGVVTAVPSHTLGSVPWRMLLPSAMLFGAVCWLNGIAIARWETAPLSSTGSRTSWLADRLALAAWSLISTCAALLALPPCRAVALAVLLAAGLLLLLHRCRYRLGRVHLRALADAALLTPLAILPFLPLLAPR